MPKTTRFAVIGCGRMGRVRMRAVAQDPASSLVAVYDIVPERAKLAASEFGAACESDAGALLRRGDVDVVYVSVPNNCHAEMVERAAVTGHHIFLEKPMSRTVEEAERMVAAVERAGKTLKIGSNVRYFPNVLKAKELLDAAAIGKPLFIRSWIGHDGWNHQSWYGDAEISGGGTFLDNGCHLFDLARWFLGEVKSCTGMVQSGLHPVSVEDNGYGLFEMESGAITYVHSSWTDWAGYLYVEVFGSEGYIRIDSRKKACLTVLGSRTGGEKVFDYSDLPPTSYQAELADYLDCLHTGRPITPSGYDGLRAVAMAAAVYESARTGQRLTLVTQVKALAVATR